MKSFIRCALLVGMLTVTSVRAATFTVVNTNNADGGSLRQALLDANAAPGDDLIEFQITNVVRAILVSSNLPVITGPVTLDGTTQAGYVNAPIVELSGNNLAGGLDGLKLATSNSTVRALVIRNFTGDGIEILGGSGNVVEGCYIGVNLTGTTDQGVALNGILISNAPNTRIGGTTDAQRNVISGNNQNGVYVFGPGATNNLILGNYIGLNAAGAANIANSANGVLISNAPQNTVGGLAAGERNLLGGNSSSGVRFEGTNAFGNSVIGNFIGLDVTGTTNRGNGANGVYLLNAPGNTVGGVTAAERNLISGNNSVGVRIDGVNARGNLVAGNFIGVDASGVLARGNNNEGVLIQNNARDNVIGGADPGAGNLIAFNNSDGVAVAAGTNNAIRANAIHSSTGLGIDLGANGILANDAGDPDAGANQLQNYPILSAASNTASSVTIVGSLNSRPATTYALDFFANQLPELGTNFSEGRFYLGSTNVITGVDSNVAFTVTFPVALQGRLITATATDPTNNTSEFSPYVVSVSTATPLTFTVTTTNDSGPGSLRQAILDSNARISATNNTIDFNIPGSGVRMISPPSGSPLPAISEAVTIDGFTQTGSTPNSLASGNNAVWLIRLDGNNTGPGADGLKFVSSGNLVRGLMITRFNSDGIELATNQNNVIVGNCVGLDENGADQGNGADGILLLASSDNRIGGTAPADRNIISGNQSDGVEVNGLASSNNVILGNVLGPDLGGTIDRGNNSRGVALNGAPNNVIGGIAAGAGNLISGNNPNVEITGVNATNNLVLGNLIGPALTGTAALTGASSGHGVHFSSNARFNTVGDTNAGAGNVIAFNGGDGIYVQAGTNNALRANNIYSNSALGIDLDPDNILANDPGDPDVGANQRQNYPVITNVVLHATTTLVEGFLNSRPSATYFLDFFASFTRDPTFTNGEGQTYIGSMPVTTGADSNAFFSVTLPGAVTTGRWITATATDTNNNTSEFSTAVRADSTRAGGTFTVINTNNSGLGSLRQAILDNNSSFSSSNNLIQFQIPDAGPHTIGITNALPGITEAVTMDGYTQPGAQTNSLADGNNAALQIRVRFLGAVGSPPSGLVLEASSNVVRGLVIAGFTDAIRITSPFNLIEGNFIGLDADGTTVLGNVGNGILIANAPGNLIGGASPGARNVISGNNSDGVELNGAGSRNNVVQGNFIGTDASGTLDRGNNQDGVLLESAPDNLVGGALASDRNVISGNNSDGIAIQGGASTNNQVLNNNIGIDVTGTLPVGNSVHGVLFTSASPSSNQIGSPNPGGNTIAFNGQDGVYVSAGTNNAIRANNIFANGGNGVGNLGIDLGTSGVLANDVPDVATGPNLQQNYPVLSNAVANPASTVVQGALTSRASTTYQIDFFSSLVADPSGNGEGQKYLGSTNVTTDAAGSAVIHATLASVVRGRYLTATATDANGNTSEFSKWLLASSTIPPLTFVVINTNNSGPGSLRQALLDNNTAVSATNNSVAFAIPGDGPHVITPLSPLPVPTESVTIDGYTQSGAAVNTLAEGNNAVLKIHLDGNNPFFDGLTLTAMGGNVVRGLSITRFNSDGIETGTNGNNVIEGNFIGLQPDGVTAAANGSHGVYLNNSPGNVIGGATLAARNVISGNNSSGVQLSGPGATGNRVEGNFIGTDATGTLDRGNNLNGVSLDNAVANVVGGTNVMHRNLISGNNGAGVQLTSNSGSNVVLGNFIGLDVSGGTGLGNGGDGVGVTAFNNTAGNLIGGTNGGAANRIAFNAGNGIYVQFGTNIAIRANNIYSNSNLGIDLDFDFVATPNDPGDLDSGANDRQNFPLLTNATIGPVNTLVQGVLNSRPGVTYQLDFFANVFPDFFYAHGEGEQYLGSTAVTTGADSNALFSVLFPVAAVGRQLTATATDPFGNTSEFSPSFGAASTLPPVTFVVTNGLDSGPGSLRQAILDHNATASGSNNLIAFNIPGPGPHIIAPLSALPAISEPVILDGFTQPGASANTVAQGNDAVWRIGLSGTNAGFVGAGLTLLTSNHVVRGLVIMNFQGAGIGFDTGNNMIEGCLIGLGTDSSPRANNQGISMSGPGNRIGGTSPASRNVISGNNNVGIFVGALAGSNNVVQGNFIGTDISGTLARGNGSGLDVNSTGTLIGGAAAGAGNIISGNNSGIIVGFTANQTVIQGNRIGLAFGDVSLGNLFSGVNINGGTALIGGTMPAERNVISANGGVGVQTSGSATNVSILGNYIGTDSSGTANRGNSGNGVSINANGARVGGLGAGEANVIAFNSQAGVTVGFGTNSAVRANRIFSNTQLGIDVGFFGVNLNDAGDADSGANNGQNFPVLTNAVASSSNTVVRGTLNSRPGAVYQLDFYSNEAGDPLGHGEGQRYLGATNVTTDGAGDGTFVFTGPALVSGRFITATATDAAGNTSEFSAWFSAAGTLPGATVTVVNTNDSGPGSLRQAMLDTELLPNAGNDVIQFAIPGSGVRTIAPLTVLPVTSEPVTINGFSQAGASANTLTNGNNAVILIRLDGTNLIFFGSDGLSFTNSGNIVRGLEIVHFQGNGIDLNAGSSNVIAGNLIWSNQAAGVFSSTGAGNRIGGLTPADRNVLSANLGAGIELRINTNSAIQGNFIGTDFAGLAPLGNGLGGVRIDGGLDNLIGPPGGFAGKAEGGDGTPAALFGNPAVMRNVISANSGVGLGIVFSAAPVIGTRVFGNLIGTDVTGTTNLGNLSAGISLSGAVGTIVGGPNAHEPNLIPFNNTDAIQVISGLASNNTIQANSMFDNGHLGIDLGSSGVLANDAGDPDGGPNFGQNFPTLTNAVITASNLVVQGRLNSEPSRSYRLDFYANVACDPTGNGEGKHWLGSANVMTGADSNANFSVNLPFAPEGDQITATAMDLAGNTSEFCACRELVSGLPPLILTVVNTNDSGPGSLRAALETNNASFTSGPNEIHFKIPGTNVQTIVLLSPLPGITRPVRIDGFTQPGSQTNQFVNNTNTGVWKIRLDGTNAGTNNVDALHFTSSSNTVRGLVIVNFSGDGIELEGGNGNLIEQNLLGIDVLTAGARLAVRGGGYGNGYGWPPGFPEFVASLQRGLNINGSSQNLVLNNFIGFVALYAIYIHQFQAYLNYCYGNILGKSPDLLPAPVGWYGVYVRDGYDTRIEGGGYAYIRGDAVRTRLLSSYTLLVNVWFFTMVYGQLHDIGDRGRDLFNSLVNYPQIAAANPNSYSGVLFGFSGQRYRITTFVVFPGWLGNPVYLPVDEFDVTIAGGGTAPFTRTFPEPIPPGTQLRSIATCFTDSVINFVITGEDSPNFTVTSAGAQPPADLAVTKTASPSPVPFGSNLVYTLTVTNHSAAAATNVVVSDALPAGLAYVDADTPQGATARTGQQVRFDLGTITNGQSLSLTIEVTVNVTNATTFTNVANVSSITSPDPVTTNNNSTNLVSAGPPSIRPALEITLENNQVVLRWTGAFLLQSAPTATGVYTDVSGATSPFTINPALASQAFYRLVSP